MACAENDEKFSLRVRSDLPKRRTGARNRASSFNPINWLAVVVERDTHTSHRSASSFRSRGRYCESINMPHAVTNLKHLHRSVLHRICLQVSKLGHLDE